MALSPRPWQTAIARKQNRKLLALIRATDAELLREVTRASVRATTIIRQIEGANVSAIVRRALYTQRRAAIAQLIQELWRDQISDAVNRRLEEAIRLGTAANEEMLKVLVRATPEHAEELAASFERSARAGLEDLRSRILNDIDLSSQVYRNQALTTGRIDRIVNEGIALGKSAREIADDVAGYIRPDVQGGVRYAATRLGRTELNNAFHTTAIRAYAESPYVEGVKWNLSGSHPRPDECNDFAEQNDYGLGVGVFPKDQVPLKPHPQCFCFTTAITISPDEFADRLVTQLNAA